jgi:hypothetical protein
MPLSNWLKNDKLSNGILLGLILPLPAALIFAVLLRLLQKYFFILGYTRIIDMLLLGLAVNLLAIRYFLVNLKLINTGKGIVASTFVIGLVFFIFLRNLNIILPF